MGYEVPWEKISLPIPNHDNLELCAANIQKIEDCRRILTEIRALSDRINALPDYEETLATVTILEKNITSLSASLFKDLHYALDKLTESEKQCLLDLSRLISMPASPYPTELENEHVRNVWDASFPTVLKHFPLWAVTRHSACLIPLFPAIFDYLIIDEASALDLPSAIPLLARAKQVVLVGDPEQLRRIAKLSITKERESLSKNGLLTPGIRRFSNRQNSLFDLASSISKLILKLTNPPTAEMEIGQ